MDKLNLEGPASERLIRGPETSKDPNYSELYAPHKSRALFMPQLEMGMPSPKNTHDAICPLKLLDAGSTSMGPDGEAIRCLALISTSTQERIFSQATFKQIQDGGTVDEETARQQAMAHNSNSPLLQLPGEIRNFIYQSLLNNKERREVRLLHRYPFSCYLFEGNEYGGSLTYVSQQIRKEFSKDHFLGADHKIWVEDLPAFMDTWLLRMATNAASVTIETVGLVEGSNCIRPNQASFIADISKLVRFRHIYPGFNFKIVQRKITDRLVAPGYATPFQQKTNVRYVEEAFEKIELRLEDYGERLFVRFQLKESVYRDWFENHLDVKREKFCDLVHWLNEILVKGAGYVEAACVEVF